MSFRTLSYPPADQSEAQWLLVVLHGWGANAEDLAGLAPYLPLPGFQMVFPDAPLAHPQVPGGRMWYGFPFGYGFRTPPNFDDHPELQTTRRLLKDWMLSLEGTTGIPLSRTVMAGFSQGGAMTLDVGAQLPLAGQMVLSGYLHSPLQQAVPERPILMVHGTFDPVVPLVLARQAKQALTEQGQPLQYHELPMGHEILPEVIQIMRDFCEVLKQKPVGDSPDALG